VCAKPACCDSDSAAFNFGDKFFVEPFGHFRLGRGHKARPAPFAAVAQQRELADHEHLSAHVNQGAIHFLFVVFEDAQARCLFSHVFCITLVVVLRNAKQHQHSRPNSTDHFVVHGHTCYADALHTSSHVPVTSGPCPALPCPCEM